MDNISDENKKLLRRAVVAVLCDHDGKDIYIRQAFSAENIVGVNDVLKKGELLVTKEDFLAKDMQGKLFMDHEGAWKNFDNCQNSEK
jgi:hypothetical protein